MMFLFAGHSAGLLSKNFVKQSFTKFLESQLHGSRRKSYLSVPFFFHLRYGWLVRGRLYMPGQRYELHHKICNLRYGTHGYLWVLPLVTWIDGFSDWISMECMFKILQFHNLWDNECKMDEYCFRFALWRWNSPFVEASAEHKCSERFIAMFNATKHNIRPFHIHVFINISDCNILFIT